MKNQSQEWVRGSQGVKHWPALLALSILSWFFLAALLTTALNPRGVRAGRVFLSQLAAGPNPGSARGGLVPGAMPSPTLYVPQAPQNTGSYLPLSFTQLSGFFFWNPIDYADEPNPAKQKRDKLRSKVPNSVMAYNGKKVAVTGFMIPLDEDDKFIVKTFVLAKSQMTCCYGATPLPNEWLFATVAPNASKVQDQMDVPLTVYGTLSIDPQLKDPSMPTLYKMSVTRVEGPKHGWF
ncbi:MAG TPA: DUF3299 domain-containing protein [bacterium]|nr:DUF3299 domain-containing protein [bacterium]